MRLRTISFNLGTNFALSLRVEDPHFSRVVAQLTRFVEFVDVYCLFKSDLDIGRKVVFYQQFVCPRLVQIESQLDCTTRQQKLLRRYVLQFVKVEAILNLKGRDQFFLW